MVAVATPCFGPAFALSDGVLLRSADRPRGRGGGGPAGGPVDGSASGTDPEESEGDGNSSLELSGPAFAAADLASALAPLRRVVFGAMLPRVCRGTLTGGPAILGAAAKQSVCTAVSQSCCSRQTLSLPVWLRTLAAGRDMKRCASGLTAEIRAAGSGYHPRQAETSLEGGARG